MDPNKIGAFTAKPGTEFVLSPDEEDVAASVRRDGEYIILELETEDGLTYKRQIPFLRYFLKEQDIHKTNG